MVELSSYAPSHGLVQRQARRITITPPLPFTVPCAIYVAPSLPPNNSPYSPFLPLETVAFSHYRAR